MLKNQSGKAGKMTEGMHIKIKKLESLFLNEHVMAAVCAFIAAAGLITLIFFRGEMDAFEIFGLLVKLAAAVDIYFTFRSFKWDVVKGLLGGVLFSLMYLEAYLVFAKLWSRDFDTYLVAGVAGSIYLAAAGMSLWMTIIITLNHFIVNYNIRSNPKNVILNRIAIIFKFAAYILLLASNRRLGLSSSVMRGNLLGQLTDIAILLLVILIESQFESFKILRQELLAAKRKAGKGI